MVSAMKLPSTWPRILFALGLISISDLVIGAPLQRESNTTLALPSSPPSFGYTSTNAFGTMTFTNPVAIASPPGETNRIFILEKRGRIIVVTNLAAPTRTMFMDLTARVSASETVSDERGLLGIAFHPGYATNRYFYVFYTGNATTPVPGGTNSLHDILARFQTTAVNPNQGDPNSELRLIVQRDEANNHNGGDLHFGPDGYLYLSLGDEGGGNDQWNNSQRITKDFFSGIVRLDVDKRPGSLPPNSHPASTTNYAVPPDNPFVGATSFNGLAVNPSAVRTEFWAVGLRNPWRMSFDPVTGRLYCADVGQISREEVNIIEKGGNYGWSYWEGFLQRTNSALIPAGFVHAPPLIDYPRSLGFSVTGGRVYRGFRLTQLYGAYVYADYGSGRIWALRHSGTNVTENTQIMTDSGISAFGVDPSNGDLLYADLNSGTDGTIDRIIYAPGGTGSPLPPTLADTGAFSDLAGLEPHAGIVPYDVNVPQWADNAIATRWFSVPNTNLTIGFSRDGNYSFPTGTVWIKHLELEMTNGVAASRQRIETQLLVKNTPGVYGITYRWGGSLTNATLVPEEGLNESFVINDGGGILRTQTWRYASRVECVQCHTPAAGYAAGFNTPQINREVEYSGTATNQIAALSLAGYFNTNVSGIHTLRSMAHPTNEAASLEFRARSYLAVNCISCHTPGGSAPGFWDARFTTPTASAGLIHGALINDAGDANNRMVTPGSLERSMLLTRISTLGAGRMPPLGNTTLDTQAIELFSRWITNDLPGYQTFADWQVAHFGSTNAPNSGPDDDADGDGAKNYFEFLTGTLPLNASSFWEMKIQRAGNEVEILFPQVANRGFELHGAGGLVGSAWTPLDVPGNEPFFSSSNRAATVRDAIQPGMTNRFYRMRVFEP
jgi:glucose/arabinose dehydrogenase/mono/diheme cytochrome c family protein